MLFNFFCIIFYIVILFYDFIKYVYNFCINMFNEECLYVYCKDIVVCCF